ncbi:efflux RND transporter periplasmic adaptor subunit, partial [Candidatus Latescibacterota bacterium]
GSVVRKGDFLVQFDTADAENEVTVHQEELDTAKSNFSAVQARIESYMGEIENNLKTQTYSYEQAEIRFGMMKYEADAKRREAELNLKKSELTLKQVHTQIESQKIVDRADIAKEELRVKQAELRYKESVDQLNSMTIRSPKDGFVVLQETYNRSSRTHEKVKVGDSPHRRMPLVSIPDLSKMIVKTSVNEVDISKIETGQKVVLTLDAVPGETFYGVISGIATLAHREEGTDNKVFDIEATLDGTDERVKPGMSAQCTIITERLPDHLIIPIDSVFEKDNTTVVYVKKRGFEQRAVKVGKRNSDFIVVEEGLVEGEEVALRDPTLLDERPIAQGQTANGL